MVLITTETLNKICLSCHSLLSYVPFSSNILVIFVSLPSPVSSFHLFLPLFLFLLFYLSIVFHSPSSVYAHHSHLPFFSSLSVICLLILHCLPWLCSPSFYAFSVQFSSSSYFLPPAILLVSSEILIPLSGPLLPSLLSPLPPAFIPSPSLPSSHCVSLSIPSPLSPVFFSYLPLLFSVFLYTSSLCLHFNILPVSLILSSLFSSPLILTPSFQPFIYP